MNNNDEIKDAKAKIARRWAKNSAQMVKELKESGKYDEVLNNVAANVVASINELVAEGCNLIQAETEAYDTWATPPA